MSSRRITALALAADVVAVVVFAAIGRMSHARPDDLLGLLGTAAPFLAGLAVAWAVPVVRAHPQGLRAGLVAWAGAGVLGLGLRFAFTGELPPTFVAVTLVSLGVLVLGWRGLTAGLTALAARRALR
ncbi:hypothetical protein BJF78_27355 [Pseudonocardia sp. CNS-139]|nr:hypothetical protein BJF78_27355 [Pseudonocardia sp. CNS-139]